jgi:transcriptional regulator with XRE-family HTH domain
MASCLAVPASSGPGAGRRDDTDARVRRRLRELRAERGLTLEVVARRAGMATSTLSRLESGARRLALDHLPALAGALGVTVDDLLASPRALDPRVREPAHTHDGMRVWPLTRHGPAAGLQAFKLRVPADRRTPHPRTHEGRDWIYVLSGRLRLVLGDDDLVLEPGEAAEFDTRTPHWIGAVDGPAEIIALFGPHGERVHLRGEA